MLLHNTPWSGLRNASGQRLYHQGQYRVERSAEIWWLHNADPRVCIPWIFKLTLHYLTICPLSYVVWLSLEDAVAIHYGMANHA